MPMNQKIGSIQATMLIANTVLATAFSIIPAILGIRLEQDSLIGILLSSCVGLAIAFLIGTIVKQSQGIPLIQWIGQKSSPVLAFMFGFVLLVHYLVTTSIILREFINVIKDNVLNRTPLWLIAYVVIGVMVYMIRHGVEAVARINIFLVLFYLIYIPVYFVGLKDFIHFSYLLPFFEHSPSAYLLGMVTPVSWMSEVSVLLFLAPYLRSPEKARVIAWTATAITTVMMLVAMVLALSVFGTEVIKMLTYPDFEIAGIIQLGNFFSNLNILFYTVWILIGYIKLAVFLFVCLECFKQTFRVSSTSPFLLGLALIIVGECIFVWTDPKRLYTYGAEKRIFEFMVFNVLLPLMIYLLSLMGRKKKKAA